MNTKSGLLCTCVLLLHLVLFALRKVVGSPIIIIIPASRSQWVTRTNPPSGQRKDDDWERLRMSWHRIPRGGGDSNQEEANHLARSQVDGETIIMKSDDDDHDHDHDRPTGPPRLYGRVSADEYRLTPEQIEAFHRDGCVTVPDVLTEEEVAQIEAVFDKFLSGEIPVPGKDFCDMSKPFGVPPEEWSIVNCMLPTTYYPPLRGNVYEKLTSGMAQQLFQSSSSSSSSTSLSASSMRMVMDYDQLLNKRPGKLDAVFAYHQDIAYWPGPKALGVNATDTCTFSLAIDDSTPENGCLRYVAGSSGGRSHRRVLREHRPLIGSSREDGHALVVDVDEAVEPVRLAPARRGSVTIHDEWVVHGSSGNASPDRNRRTYVIAYRAKDIVDAERRIGFTHSHNDEVNWDTFQDGESHRVKLEQRSAGQR
jgi:hypothetical protein